MADVVSVAASVVGLLSAVLKTVEFIGKAREDCKDAPRLTINLVVKVANTRSPLERINDTVVNNPVPENRWDDLKPILSQLYLELDGAAVTVVQYLEKDEKRKNALQAWETLKASFKLGSAKQKKASEATLAKIDELVRDLNFAVNAHVLSGVCDTLRLLGDKMRADVESPTILTKLQNKAIMCIGSERLQDVYLEIQGETGKFSAPESNQLAITALQDEATDSRGRRRGRESGIRVTNSTKIRFKMSMRGNRDYFFYVVICDLHDRVSVPKLFFPLNCNPKVHNNKLASGRWRIVPDKRPYGVTKNDPTGLTMDRSTAGVPADGDSPWAIFIVLTSQQVIPTGDTLTIADIAAIFDQTSGTEILVREFLVDVMKQG